jgi:glycosyltransferase involved in cell wall biosynthesis
MKVLLAYPESQRVVDGIRDYSLHLLEQLRSDGHDAELLRPRGGLALARTVRGELASGERATLVVQYNPFSWGRWGFAPQLAAAVGIIRATRPRVRVVLAVHEAYVPMSDARTLIMGVWQRMQVRLLLVLAHNALAMTSYLVDELSRYRPHRVISHVPVGSNLPDERASRDEARVEGGYGESLVIATLSSGHDTHLHRLVLPAVQAVAERSHEPVVLLLLGSNNVAPEPVPSVARAVTTGYLDEHELARALSTADVFLAPFMDGASTRRTTLMAALQHGIAVVTTRSERTDAALLEDGALAMAGPDDADGFAAQAVALALDGDLRARHAASCRALYERHFSWPAIAARLCGVISTR